MKKEIISQIEPAETVYINTMSKLGKTQYVSGGCR